MWCILKEDTPKPICKSGHHMPHRTGQHTCCTFKGPILCTPDILSFFLKQLKAIVACFWVVQLGCCGHPPFLETRGNMRTHKTQACIYTCGPLFCDTESESILVANESCIWHLNWKRERETKSGGVVLIFNWVGCAKTFFFSHPSKQFVGTWQEAKTTANASPARKGNILNKAKLSLQALACSLERPPSFNWLGCEGKNSFGRVSRGRKISK